MIRFTCECGKQLQAREESAGKMAICPVCKRQQQIPDVSPEAIQSDEPDAPASQETGVRKSRPVIREEEAPDAEDRPRRARAKTGSGKAIASLVLGIVSLCGCSCLTGLPSILLGILSLRDISRAGGMMTGKVMAIIGMALGGLGTICVPPVSYFGGRYIKESVEQAANKAQSQNNLKQMALAMHNYHDSYRAFPPAGLGNPFGPPQPPMGQKPLLSWRVALLPYLGFEADQLYRQFHQNEAWDSPHNRTLLAKMPKVYKLPGDTKTPADHTVYQVFVGPGTVFEPGQRVRMTDIRDGTVNTILIVEAAKGVPWTKPEDVPFNPNQSILPLLGGHFSSGFHVALADGSVRQLKPNISEKTLKAAITRNGNEPLGNDW